MPLSKTFSLTGTVELFPGKGGWHFVRVPQKYTEETKVYADRGLVAIETTLGGTTWKSSLLPMGDGSTFIPLSAKVRKSEKIELGDTVSLEFRLRER